MCAGRLAGPASGAGGMAWPASFPGPMGGGGDAGAVTGGGASAGGGGGAMVDCAMAACAAARPIAAMKDCFNDMINLLKKFLMR